MFMCTSVCEEVVVFWEGQGLAQAGSVRAGSAVPGPKRGRSHARAMKHARDRQSTEPDDSAARAEAHRNLNCRKTSARSARMCAS
eukprot:scaffold37769_cov71-Phaeocystis_antarctica.AAC.2